jgi:hypothetical protein
MRKKLCTGWWPSRLQVGVELGDFAQKGGFVVAQRVFDLVGHRELAKAQQPGLPQLHHAGAHLRLVGGQFTRGERVFFAVKQLPRA